jgi:hypothetical protein
MNGSQDEEEEEGQFLMDFSSFLSVFRIVWNEMTQVVFRVTFYPNPLASNDISVPSDHQK